MSKKVIYHFGSLAGWPYTLAKGFRDKGYDSVNIVSFSNDNSGVTRDDGKKSNRQLPYDKCLFDNNDSKIKKTFKAFSLIFEIIKKGSVLHYHGGTILPNEFDTYIFKFFKIPMVMSWGGTDARLHRKTIENNPYFYKFYDDVHDNNIIEKFKRLSLNNVVLASDPEMKFNTKEYFENIFTFRAPIDLEKYKYNQRKFEIPTFLHIPTHRFAKGTVHILNAVKKLKENGYNFNFILLEAKLTQNEVMDQISNCDVYLDELRVGCHGVTTVEAMSLGKVTLTYIRDDLIKDFPGEFPIINTNPDTIYDNMKDLIINPKKINVIGKKSREYVEKYHDINKVLEDLIVLYREVGIQI